MDWQTVGVRLAPILTLLFGLGTAISVYFLIQTRRTAHSTSFGYVREQSLTRGKRLVILIVVLIVFASASSALWVISIQDPGLLPTPMPTATLTLIPSPTPRTPTATFTVTPTPTSTPVPTPTPIPPDAELPAALRTPFPSLSVTASPDAALVGLVLAAGEDSDRPIGSGVRFPSGTARVYAFFTFDGMARNVPWVHVWYAQVDGGLVEVWSQVELWSYDAAHGSTWRFFNCRDGRYELHVYVGRDLQQKVSFSVGVD
jgi:hypothetical protein